MFVGRHWVLLDASILGNRSYEGTTNTRQSDGKVVSNSRYHGEVKELLIIARIP